MAERDLWSDTLLSGTTTEGRWDVTVQRVGEQLYLLDSRGRAPAGAIEAGTDLADQWVASRRLGLLARLSSASLNAPAALTTHDDVGFKGAPPRIIGFDEHAWSAPYCTGSLEDLPGLVTDNDDGLPAPCQEDGGGGGGGGGGGKGKGKGGGGGGGGGSCSWIQGNPHTVEDEVLVDEVFDSYEEMWDELVSLANITVSGGNLKPAPSLDDGQCNTLDPLNWGDPMNPGAPCGGYFPLIHVTDDVRFTGNGAGQGVLLVDGSATWVGTFDFFGIVLVKGNVEMRGTPTIRGAVIAEDADNWRGTPDLIYSSCAVSRAVLENDALTSLQPLDTRGWVDLSAIGN